MGGLPGHKEFRCWSLAAKGGRQTRRPNPETRKKPESRGPKAPGRRRLQQENVPVPCQLSAFTPECATFQYGAVALSDFALRPSFGFRTSDFGFPRPRNCLRNTSKNPVCDLRHSPPGAQPRLPPAFIPLTSPPHSNWPGRRISMFKSHASASLKPKPTVRARSSDSSRG